MLHYLENPLQHSPTPEELQHRLLADLDAYKRTIADHIDEQLIEVTEDDWLTQPFSVSPEHECHQDLSQGSFLMRSSLLDIPWERVLIASLVQR